MNNFHVMVSYFDDINLSRGIELKRDALSFGDLEETTKLLFFFNLSHLATRHQFQDLVGFHICEKMRSRLGIRE